jgi:chromosome segregation ATPase
MACINSRVISLTYLINGLTPHECNSSVKHILNQLTICLEELASEIEELKSEVTSFNEDIQELETSIQEMERKETDND